MRVLGALVSVLHLHAVQSKSKPKDDTSRIQYWERECTELEISSKATKQPDGRMFKECRPMPGSGSIPLFHCRKDDDCKEYNKALKIEGGLVYKLMCSKAEEKNYQGLKEWAIEAQEKGNGEEMPKKWKSKLNKLLKGSQNICDGLTQCQTNFGRDIKDDIGLCIEPITCEGDEDCSEITMSQGGLGRLKRKCVPYKKSRRCEITLPEQQPKQFWKFGQFVE